MPICERLRRSSTTVCAPSHDTTATPRIPPTPARSLFRPSWIPAGSKVLLYATRAKAALGYSPEVAVIAIGESKTVVAGLDALTGVETYREEFGVKVTSAVPLGVKDGQERSVIMLVDRWGRGLAGALTGKGGVIGSCRRFLSLSPSLSLPLSLSLSMEKYLSIYLSFFLTSLAVAGSGGLSLVVRACCVLCWHSGNY